MTTMSYVCWGPPGAGKGARRALGVRPPRRKKKHSCNPEVAKPSKLQVVYILLTFVSEFTASL